jgi:hypothetical protein
MKTTLTVLALILSCALPARADGLTGMSLLGVAAAEKTPTAASAKTVPVPAERAATPVVTRPVAAPVPIPMKGCTGHPVPPKLAR